MSNTQSSLHSDVLTIQDLAKKAEEALPRTYAQYYNGGAGDMSTLRDNEDAYNRYKLRPRVLRNVEKVDMSSEIFGVKVPSPLGFSPTAAHKLATPAGEIATSRAAAKNGVPMCLSTWSTTPLEDVIAQGAGNPYAMQVSFFADLAVTERIIRRAERAGYKALFVSVDLPVLGNRVSEARMKFSFPSHITFPNIQEGEGDLMAIYGAGYDPSIHWEKSIAWLRNNTNLEIWLKGIVTPEDVQLAIDYGLDGVVISNHGGRQLDGQPSTLDALRECGPVARGKIPLAVDGGIRRGADVFKAIAMGASMCFVGRLQIWGLAYAGESGVEHAIKIILQEFKHTMMFMGCRTIVDITPQHLSLLHENGLLSKL